MDFKIYFYQFFHNLNPTDPYFKDLKISGY